MRRPELALGLVGVDAMSIEIGAELARLLAPPLADGLLDRIGEVRRALAADIGVVLPGVRLRDELSRDPHSYGLRVRDRLVAHGRLELDRVLAVADEAILQRFAGTIESEPVYGLPASWIAPGERDRAVEAGALVFDPISVLGSHVAEVARRNAAELLGRQELATLFEHLRTTVPALMKEIGGDALPFGSVHRAFCLLLREGAWPRDPVAALEAMLAAATRDPRELAEAARREIVPALLRRRTLAHLEPALLDPELERRLSASWSVHGADASAPNVALALRARIETYVARTPRDRAAVICTTALRPWLADFLLRSGIRVDVFAYGELPAELELRPAEIIAEHEVELALH
jgi:flagellar biosynthesis protein FlhA